MGGVYKEVYGESIFVRSLLIGGSFYPGVIVLFAISGFLIAGSLEHSKNWKDYLTKRLLRLLPGFYVQTLINTVVIVVLCGIGVISVSLLKWLIAQFAFVGYTPGMLKDFATGSVNGALWTIPVELQLYIVILIAFRWLKKFKMSHWVVLLCCCALVNIGWEDFTNIFTHNAIRQILGRLCVPYILWFAIGVFCYMNFDNVIYRLQNLSVPMIPVYIVIRLLWKECPGYYVNVFTGIIVPFIVIGLAFKLKKHRAKIEISYGMYLYHWIVLNIFAHYEIHKYVGEIVCFLLFVAITVLLAYLSYRFVERPFLQRKS